MATDTLEHAESLVAALALDDGFRPQEVRSEKESGLSASLIEDLVLKYLSGVGTASGRAIADHICLPLVVLEGRYAAMRTRQDISPVSSAIASSCSRKSLCACRTIRSPAAVSRTP